MLPIHKKFTGELNFATKLRFDLRQFSGETQ
jgi:hypothetical protein